MADPGAPRRRHRGGGRGRGLGSNGMFSGHGTGLLVDFHADQVDAKAPVRHLAGIEKCFPVEVIRGPRPCHREIFVSAGSDEVDQMPSPSPPVEGGVRCAHKRQALPGASSSLSPRATRCGRRPTEMRQSVFSEPRLAGRGRPLRGPLCRERGLLRPRGLQQGRGGWHLRRAEREGALALPEEKHRRRREEPRQGRAARSWPWRPTPPRCPPGTGAFPDPHLCRPPLRGDRRGGRRSSSRSFPRRCRRGLAGARRGL